MKLNLRACSTLLIYVCLLTACDTNNGLAPEREDAGVATTRAKLHALHPFCDGVFQMCGFRNPETKLIKIPTKFEYAYRFNEGLAPVRMGGKFGYISGDGNWAIDPQFDLVSGFQDGRAFVRVENQIGQIDRTGAFIIEPRFTHAFAINSEVLIARDGTLQSSLKIPLGSVVSDGAIELSINEPLGGLYHIEEGWLTEQDLIFSRFSEASSELVWVSLESKRELKKIGLMRTNGEWVLEPQFELAYALSEGRAVVKNKAGLWGAVNAEGAIVVPLVHDWLNSWQDGYALTREGEYGSGSDGLIDLNGNLVGGQFFDKVERRDGDWLPRVRDGESWMSVAPDGTLIPDEREGEVLRACAGTLTMIRRSGKMAVYDNAGQQVTDRLFEIPYFNPDTCSEPLSVSSGKGKWHIITLNGRFIEDATDVPIEEYWVDGNGAPLPEHVSEEPDPKSADHLLCRGGGKLVTENGLWGMVGPEGTQIIPSEHRALVCFQFGRSLAPSDTEEAWCPIGPEGTFTGEPSCEQSIYPYIVSHHEPEPFASSAYENSVLWYAAYLEHAAGLRDVAPTWIADELAAASYSVRPGR